MWKNNIEKLENVPKRESRKEYITRKYGDFWNLRRFESHYISDKNDNPWHIISTILKGSIGKNIDKVYSKVCKAIRSQDKDTFKWFFGNRGRYYIDKNKCIQLNPIQKKSKKVTFYSHDFKYGYVPKKEFHKKYLWIDDGYLDNIRWFRKNDFERIVVSGFSKTFSSKNDPEYIKLVTEERKRRKKEERNKLPKVYSFVHEE